MASNGLADPDPSLLVDGSKYLKGSVRCTGPFNFFGYGQNSSKALDVTVTLERQPANFADFFRRMEAAN